MKSITVFVCGEALRGDDAAARAAASGLPPHARLSAHIREVGALAVEDLLALTPGSVAIVVDTVIGTPAGGLVCFELAELPLKAAGVTPRSTHQLPLDQVIGMAVLLGAGVQGSFLGVGGSEFGIGQPMSAAVRRAVPSLRAALAAEIELLSGSGRIRRGRAAA